MLRSHHPEQTLARCCRDVVQNEGNLGPCFQKGDSFVAMGTIRLKEDVKAAVPLPSEGIGVWRRCRSPELENYKHRNQRHSQENAKPSGCY
jgi:hypothetical protein